MAESSSGSGGGSSVLEMSEFKCINPNCKFKMPVPLAALERFNACPSCQTKTQSVHPQTPSGTANTTAVPESLAEQQMSLPTTAEKLPTAPPPIKPEDEVKESKASGETTQLEKELFENEPELDQSKRNPYVMTTEQKQTEVSELTVEENTSIEQPPKELPVVSESQGGSSLAATPTSTKPPHRTLKHPNEQQVTESTSSQTDTESNQLSTVKGNSPPVEDNLLDKSSPSSPRATEKPTTPGNSRASSFEKSEEDSNSQKTSSGMDAGSGTEEVCII